MPFATPTCNRTVLLGAGFSKNYGGFLAGELCELLLVQPQIKNNDYIRVILRDEDYNYESALATIRKCCDNDTRRIFEEAVMTVYQQQNALILNCYQENLISQIQTQNFFNMFSHGKMVDNKWAGYVFTLNQDIQLERFLRIGVIPNERFALPGVEQKHWFFRHTKLAQKNCIAK